MSEAVEQRVYELLDRPSRSPYGNPIPGLDELDGDPVRQAAARRRAQPRLPGPGRRGDRAADLRERADRREVLRQLHAAGIDPGATVDVAQDRDEVIIDGSGEQVRLPRELASRVFVTPADAAA